MNAAPSIHASGLMVPGMEWSWGTHRGPGPPADLPSGASPQEGVDVREFGCGQVGVSESRRTCSVSILLTSLSCSEPLCLH